MFFPYLLSAIDLCWSEKVKRHVGALVNDTWQSTCWQDIHLRWIQGLGGVLHLWRLAAASKGSSQAGSSRRTEREARWPGGPPVHTPSPLVHTSPGIRCLHSALEAHLQWQAMHADILLQSDFCPENFLRLHFQDVSSSRAVAVGHSWERTAVSTQLVARGASGL